MIPITFSFTNILILQVQKEIKNTAKKKINKLQQEVENQELKKENLEKQNKIIEQNIAINSLNNQIALLKSSQVSAMQFQKIAEIALIKTNIQQTKVWNGPISDLEAGWGIKANYYDDNLLVINTYDIDAKFGIDFNNIKIKKISNQKIQVSGITPTYIGSSKNIKDSQVKEIRRYDYDSNGNIKKINVKNDSISIKEADSIENELDKEYQKSLQSMENWEYLNDAIVTLGQNFVKLIFAPVYDEIVFTDEEDAEALTLKEYIETEIKNGEAEALNLKKSLIEVTEKQGQD